MRSDYRLVYRGHLLPGIDTGTATANLVRLFHVSEQRITYLLTHTPCVIKEHVDIDAGNRYLEALAEAGLVTHLELVRAGDWDGCERRQQQRRQRLGERRHSERAGAIRPDRRSTDRRRPH